MRDAVNHALRELLTNAVEWGGRLDPDRNVRVTCVRGVRSDPLSHRSIPDPGSASTRCPTLRSAILSTGRSTTRSSGKKRRFAPAASVSPSSAAWWTLTYNEAHNEVIFVKYLPPQ